MGFGDRDMAPTTGIGVKKPGSIEKCSKEEYEARIKAIVHSKRDIAWWAENFFNIITMDDGMKVIKLYPKQREFLQHLAKHNKTICLSARQTGKTTSYTIFCLWLATLFPEKAIMICANKLQTALEIMKRLRDAYEQLPQFIKPGVLVYNKGEILFSNMSSIKAFSTSSSAARGQSGNCVEKSTKVTIRLFKWLKLTIPIKWLTYFCKSKNDNVVEIKKDVVEIRIDE